MTDDSCSSPDCPKSRHCKGLCVNHYARFKRNGDLVRRIAPKNLSPEERLKFRGWSVKAGDCWEINGLKDKNGYGVFTSSNGPQRAHRMAHQSWTGPIPAGEVVRHKCDNPPCINPEHLETGTIADNNKDTVDRGRARWKSGENHGLARRSNEEVREIRREYLNGVLTMKMLGEVYGVSHGVISCVIRNQTYVDA